MTTETQTTATKPAVTLDPKDVAEEWVERCMSDFAMIARTKEAFFLDIFNEGKWKECYSFADESRRYSSLIRLIFASAKSANSALTPPSQTELNSWYQRFTQLEALKAANVPDHLLPKNRGMSAVLASATAKIPDLKQKTESQKAILQKFQQESMQAVQNNCNELPFTSASLKGVAQKMGYRKPKFEREIVYRGFNELDFETWGSISKMIQELRSVVLSQLPAEQEHSKVLDLARRMEGAAIRPSRFLFGVFDSKECFVALLFENYVGKIVPMEKGVQNAKRHVGFIAKGGMGACWSSTGYDIEAHGVEFVSAGQPLPYVTPTGDEGMTEPASVSQPVMAMSEKEADKVVDSAVTALHQSVVPIPLATWRDWESRFEGIPVGTYVDEVLEPTASGEVEDMGEDGEEEEASS